MRGACGFRKVGATALMVVLLGAAVARALEPAQARKLEEARKHYNKGRHERAMKLLNTLKEAAPDDTAVRRLRGHTLAELGRFEAARAELEAALQRGALRPGLLNRLVRLHRKQDRRAAARRGLGLLMLLEPEEARWPLLAGAMAREAGEQSRARVLHAEAAALRPASPGARVRLGNAALADGDRRTAVRAFETAYFLAAGSDPGLVRRIAGLWEELGETEAALAWYARLPEASRDATIRLRMARLARKQGGREAARRHARAVTEDAEGKNVGKAHALLGRIAAEQGDAEAAARHLEKAADTRAATRSILAFLGRHHFAAERPEKAVDYLQRRLARGAVSAGLHRLTVRALLAVGRRDAARRRLQQYVARHGLDEKARTLVQGLGAAK